MTIITSEAVPQAPQGTQFHVTSCPFVYGERIDISLIPLDDDKIFDWPVVYILANKSAAYVGQTTCIAKRIDQHGANIEKRDFTTVNIISNDEFNMSVITSYEHRLIQLIQADGKFKLTNKNEGFSESNYYSKTEYDSMFKDLWEKLQGLELAEHSVSEIEESEVFKYSPFKGLNPDQKVALDKIIETIEAKFDGKEFETTNPIVVEGMPGTGKTVLAVYLLKLLKDDPVNRGLNIRLLEPVTALRKTLKKSLKGISNIKSSDIIGPSDLAKPSSGFRRGQKGFDILLVDEAHLLKQRVNLGLAYKSFDEVNEKLGLASGSNQLEWILSQSKLPVLFYDPMQVVGPSCISRTQMEDILGHTLDNPITLENQMRVKGGKRYLRYISSILNNKRTEPCVFEDYDFVIHDDFKGFLDSFEKTLSDHNLSRLLAGYAWPWTTKKNPNPELYDIEIEGIKKRWNFTNENWVGCGLDSPDVAREIGCIHSIQGYDLSYAYVIIGNDVRLTSTGLLEADKSNYFDQTGRNTATDEELSDYIKNIYYVLLTRGIFGTHVYVCDPTLREYFARYIPHAERA